MYGGVQTARLLDVGEMRSPPADVNCEGGLHLAAGGSKNTLNTYRMASWQQQDQKVQFNSSLQKFYTIISYFCDRLFPGNVFF
jgi:hypothetical protein